MNKVPLISKSFLEEMQSKCKFQTMIDNDRMMSFIKEWNTAIEMIGDDTQTLYHQLHIMITERFLRGHMWIDGNKRTHMYMTNFINTHIKNDDIL